MYHYQVSECGIVIRVPGQEETGHGKFNTKGFILVLHPNPYGSTPTKSNKGNSRNTNSFIWSKAR